jgi:hypothetical protein
VSPSAAQCFSEIRWAESVVKTPALQAVYSVPAKSFVLGEYAVLAGAPALVAAFGPRFRLCVDRRKSGEGSGQSSEAFHPASPAGRLLALVARENGSKGELGFQFRLEDPFRAEGGFGASTGQFALVYGALAQSRGWKLEALAARQAYRELMKSEALPPSGADLIAQWQGGVVCFDPSSEKIEPFFSALDWRDMLVFSAAALPGRKVLTHEHLAQLAGSGAGQDQSLPLGLVRTLRPILDRALGLQSAATLGRAMKDYALALSSAGLELPAARADREALCAVPGVIGAKGTGALLADGLVVLLEPGSPFARSAAIAVAEKRGLRLVADGLGATAEAGFAMEEQK